MERIAIWMCVCACTATALGAGSGQLACAEPSRCRYVGGAHGTNYEQQYSVEDHDIIIIYEDGRYVQVDCNGWAALDSSALPRFTSEVRVPRVTLTKCPPPAGGGSYVHTLAKLNVTLLRFATQRNLTLLSLPPHPPLEATHFTGLEDLVELKLVGTCTFSRNHSCELPTPIAGFLSGLRSLRSLTVQSVRLSPGELANPPATLRVLSLRSTAAERPPTEVLALPNLYNLVMSEERLIEFAVPSTLRMLSLTSKNTTFQLESIPELETLMLTKWSQASPDPIKRCDALLTITLLSPAIERLPTRWLAMCQKLKGLHITNFNLTSLPPELLKGANAIQDLSLTKGFLKTLPVDLLHDLPNLRTLDLTNNHLQMLPSGMFASTRQLQTLNLSKNQISADTVQRLAGLETLETLNLASNPRLGDLCDGADGYSRLNNMKKLTSLFLLQTNITHICRDWRESLRSLKILNLNKTNISELWFPDLQYIRDDSVTESVVLLEGAPVVSVRYTEGEYKRSQRLAASGARVQLDEHSRLECDCHMYWTRLALFPAGNLTRVQARLSELRCSDGRALRALPPDELVCRADGMCREAQVPANCSCTARPEPGDKWLVHVHCEGLALTRVPPLRLVQKFVYDLLLANNNITELRITDLPTNWRKLDIRNNSLERVDEETAWALLRSPQQLLLAGNPIACDCRAAPLLLALHSAGDTASDQRVATCSGPGGGTLDKAPTTQCARVPLAAWLAGALAALLAATAAVVAYFTPPERRVLIKVLLHRWGVLRLPPEPPAPQGGFLFDAFVCFSHKDEDTMLELMKGLEGGANPYRLCLHCRDWVPGRLILDQIGESMRVSRRTVVLVSQAYFESDWTQAEFREAYALALRDVTPRLVVVLLEDPSKLPLDDEMQRYISTNTYVRWGDPWFWDKLRMALGNPLPPLAATATSIPPATLLPPIATSAVLPAKSSETRPSTISRPSVERLSESTDTTECSLVSNSLDTPTVTTAPKLLSELAWSAAAQELGTSSYTPPAPLPASCLAVSIAT